MATHKDVMRLVGANDKPADEPKKKKHQKVGGVWIPAKEENPLRGDSYTVTIQTDEGPRVGRRFWNTAQWTDMNLQPVDDVLAWADIQPWRKDG